MVVERKIIAATFNGKMNMKTVKEILIEKLKEMDADGLAGENCGCRMEDGFDFMACNGESNEDCVPAKCVSPTEEDKAEYGDDVEWVMKPMDDEDGWQEKKL